MAIIKTKARQDTGVARVSEGGDVYVRSTRDGSLFMADWKQAMIMEGRGFMINVGALTAPITGGGTGSTKPDADSPDISILVPNGTSLLPIRVEIEVSLPVIAATGNEVDILLGVDQDASHIADATAAGAAEVAYNMNTPKQLEAGEWHRGVSPPRSPKTVRERLRSPGSHRCRNLAFARL